MLFPECIICVVQKGCEHAAVFHIMPIYDIVSASCKAARCEEWSPADRIASVKSPSKIILLVLCGMHHGVVDCRSFNGKPSGQILIFLPQRLILWKNAVLCRQSAAPRLRDLFLHLMHLFGKRIISRLFLLGTVQISQQ